MSALTAPCPACLPPGPEAPLRSRPPCPALPLCPPYLEALTWPLLKSPPALKVPPPPPCPAPLLPCPHPAPPPSCPVPLYPPLFPPCRCHTFSPPQVVDATKLAAELDKLAGGCWDKLAGVGGDAELDRVSGWLLGVVEGLSTGYRVKHPAPLNPTLTLTLKYKG